MLIFWKRFSCASYIGSKHNIPIQQHIPHKDTYTTALPYFIFTVLPQKEQKTSFYLNPEETRSSKSPKWRSFLTLFDIMKTFTISYTYQIFATNSAKYLTTRLFSGSNFEALLIILKQLCQGFVVCQALQECNLWPTRYNGFSGKICERVACCNASA